MSKAFTKDEGEGSEALIPARARSASGEKRPITPEGHRTLLRELEALRSGLASESAASESAASESAASETSASELATAETSAVVPNNPLEAELRRKERARRIETLDTVLSEVQVVAPPGGSTVAFGAWVTLEDEDGRTVTYRLVGPDEADAKASLVSIASPLARALLGKEAGDEVVVERPRGAVSFTVLSVSDARP